MSAASPGPRRAAQAPDAHRHQRAVLVEQRHDVGDGAQGDDVDVGAQRQRQLDARLAPRLHERVRQLERHADAGQVRERVVAELGVDHDAVGQGLARLVMVGDDARPCPGPWRCATSATAVDAAVDGDQQARAFGRQLVDDRRRQAVPVAEAIRQAPADVGAHARAGPR